MNKSSVVFLKPNTQIIKIYPLATMDAILNHVNTEEKIIIALLDNLDYLDGGLCMLAYNLLYDELIDGIFYDDIIEWLDANIPFKKYNSNSGHVNRYSWQYGNIEPRYYWLKNKLSELQNQK